ncbi:hypothetical protein [Nonomuraea sediminis]|nr:hypothetical protein [Nonomuraea sediminis]
MAPIDHFSHGLLTPCSASEKVLRAEARYGTHDEGAPEVDLFGTPRG